MGNNNDNIPESQTHNDNENITKYKEMYDYSLNIYKELNNSNRELQEKAWKYFTALTVIIGFFIYYINWSFKLNILDYTCLSYLWIVDNLILSICFIINWFLLFKVVSIVDSPALPMKDDILEFFKTNRLIDIYNTMPKSINTIVKEKLKIHEEKGNDLKRASFFLKLNSILIIASLIFLLIKIIVKNV